MGLGLSKTVEKNVNAALTAIDIVPAVPSGLMFWTIGAFSDVNLARRDFAKGRKFTAVGSLTAGTNYLTGQGNAKYLRTGEMEPNDWTYFFYGKRDDTAADAAHQGAPMGAYGGASKPGVIVFWSGATAFRAQAYDVSGQRTATISVPNATLMKKYVATCNNSKVTVSCTTDSSYAETSFLAGRQVGSLPIRLLSSNSLVFGGIQGGYHHAMYNRVLTTDEINAHWLQVDLHAARDGIVENT